MVLVYEHALELTAGWMRQHSGYVFAVQVSGPESLALDPTQMPDGKWQLSCISSIGNVETESP